MSGNTSKKRDHSDGTSNANSKRLKISDKGDDDGTKKSLQILGSGLKCTQHGVIFQLNLTMLVLWRAHRERNAEFRVTSELSEAEKFDDVVFQYRNGKKDSWKFRLLQAKHKEGEKLAGITKNDLLSSDDKEPFCLQKYFKSFANIKERYQENSAYSVFSESEIEDVILITNAGLNFNNEDLSKYFEEVSLETDKILHIPKATNVKQYKLRMTIANENDNDIISKCKRNFKDNSNFDELINLLIRHIKESTQLNKKGLIKDYYYPLMRYVFEAECRGKRQKFLKFSNDFLNLATLPKEVLEFRNGLVKVVESTSPKIILKDMEIKTSNDFTADYSLMEKADIIDPVAFAQQIYEILRKVKGTLVTINKSCVAKNEQLIFEHNVQMLGGHVLISKYSKIRFSTSFIRSEELSPVLDKFREELKEQFDDHIEQLYKLEFIIDIPKFETCEEGVLDRKLPKPYNDDDFKEFFNKFKLIVNYPNRKELNTFLGEELQNKYKSLDCTAFSHIYQNYMNSWLADRMTTFYTVKRTRELFEEIHNDVLLCVQMQGFNESYFLKIPTKYRFKCDDYIKHFLASDKLKRLDLIFESLELGCIRTVQSFQNIKSDQLQKYTRTYGHLFLNSRQIFSSEGTSTIINKMKSKLIKLSKNKDKWNLIVVDCEEERSTEQITAFLRLINDPVRKIIFIMSKNVSVQDGSDDTIKIGMCDLMPESQKEIYKNGKINLQGEEISLNEVFDEKMAEKLIDAKTLIKLMNNKIVVVGRKKLCFNAEYDQQYYIDRNIFEIEIKNEIENDTSFGDKLVINSSEEDSLIYQKWGKSVHYLEKTSKTLVWQKSIGPIYNLMKYRKNGANCFSVNENTFLRNGQNRKTVIISDTAGMGKSTIMSSLSRKLKDRNERFWIVRIDLNDFTVFLNENRSDWEFDEPDQTEEELKKTEKKAVQFLFQLIQTNEKTKLKSVFEENLFMHCLLEDSKINMALIFDGFDEISPTYNTIVLNLLSALQNSHVALLFVTTRPYLQDELERKLGAFFHTIEPFSESNQIEFLKKFWKSRFHCSNEKRLTNYATAVIQKHSKSINDKLNTFTGIPLQLRMLAEILEKECKNYLDSLSDVLTLPEGLNNLLDLYEKFIKKKFEIYSLKAELNSANAKMDELKTLARESFESEHELLALNALLDSKDVEKMLSENEMKKVRNAQEKIEIGRQTHGLVDGISEQKPHFVHRTFAEYFVARFLVRTMPEKQQQLSLFAFLFGIVLRDDEFEIVRLFLDRMLEKVQIQDTLLEAMGTHLIDETNWNKYMNDAVILKNVRYLDRIHQFVCDCCKSDYSLLIKSIIAIKTNKDNVPIYQFNYNNIHWNCLIILKVLVLNGINLDAVYKWRHTNLGSSFVKHVKYIHTDHNGACFFLGDIFRIDHYSYSFQLVKLLLENCPKLIKDYSVDLLHLAVWSNNIDVCKLLIGPVADGGYALNIHEKTSDGWTLIQSAVINSQLIDLNLFTWLIEQGLNFDEPDPDGCSPLYHAVTNGKIEFVKYLMKKGAKMEAPQTRYRQTPLHVAANENDLDFCEELIKSGVEVNAQGNNGYTPLHTASSKGNWEVVNYLIDNSAEVNAQCNDGNTPLLVANAHRGFLQVIRYLVEKGANVNAKNKRDETALHRYSMQDLSLTMLPGDVIVEILKYLKGNNVNAQCTDGNTPLLLAVKNGGSLDLIKCLVENGAEANVKNKIGETALHRTFDDSNYVNYLIEKGADVNVQCADGDTPLHRALTYYSEQIFEPLLAHAATDVNVKNKIGETALHKAVACDNLLFVQYLIKKNADVNAQCNDKNTPLHLVAAHQESLQVIRYLVEKDANVNVKNKRDETALHKLFMQDLIWLPDDDIMEIVKYLKGDKDANVTAQCADGNTPLLVAVEYGGSLDIIKCLVESGAKVNLENKFGETALHKAITSRNKNLSVVKYLIEKGADVNAQCADGNTPLLLIVKYQRSLDFIECLVENGANVNIKNKRDETVLHRTYNDRNYVNYFIKKGADINAQCANGDTPLHNAITYRALQIFECLLAHDANVNVKNKIGETVLHKAVRQNFLIFVTYLIKKGAHVNIQCDEGNTPLDLAVTHRFSKIEQYLASNVVNSSSAMDLAITERSVDNPNVNL